MQRRTLLADIGNTCIKIAFSSSDELGRTYSLPTKSQHTADSLGLSLLQMLSLEGLPPDSVTGCILCSVVPDLAETFREACIRNIAVHPLSFPEDFQIDLTNGYARPYEVGADRLLAAFASRHLFPAPESIISVDFGTATTFDCVTGSTYLGGLICPGLYSSRSALASGTAKLPRISLDFSTSESVIGKSTASSMTHGFLYGFASMTEGLCLRLKRELPGETLVIGTGGIAAELSQVCSAFDVIRPDLVMEGMRMLCHSQFSKLRQ